MIALVDYGMGNLGSVDKALRRVGCEVTVTSHPEVVRQARGVVLPGVGAFDDCMANLRKRELIEPIREAIAAGIPFLGICLGLQLLFERSEEGGKCPGLGVFPGEVVRFRHDLKIPHIGWNQVRTTRPVPHLAGVPSDSFVYFVHSYHVVPQDPSLIATTTDYGYEFVSSVQQGSLFACQFHPEKSQDVGLRILSNFCGELKRVEGCG